MSDAFPVMRRHRAKFVRTRTETKVGRAEAKEYDWQWEKLAAWWMRHHPYCRFCEQEGKEARLASSVDHIIPIVADRSLKYDRGNLQSLCSHHHFRHKALLERICSRLGMILRLPELCGDLAKRTALLQKYQHGA